MTDSTPSLTTAPVPGSSIDRKRLNLKIARTCAAALYGIPVTVYCTEVQATLPVSVLKVLDKVTFEIEKGLSPRSPRPFGRVGRFAAPRLLQGFQKVLADREHAINLDWAAAEEYCAEVSVRRINRNTVLIIAPLLLACLATGTYSANI